MLAGIMAARHREQDVWSQLVLLALLVVACVAGIPPLVGSVTQLIAQSKPDAPRAGSACRACGIVEEVQEVTLDEAKHNVSTVSGEGFGLFVGLLTGRLGTAPVRIHEVAVRLQDGSVRVFRESRTSAWKTGDRVKITMGQIRQAS